LTEFRGQAKRTPKDVAFHEIMMEKNTMPANQPASPRVNANGGARGDVNGNSETNSPSDSSHELVPATGNGNQSERRTARGQPASYEFIDCGELARRWDVPVTWIRDQVRQRAEDPLPHVNLGKYVRFLWGSPELQAWIERRIVIGNNRRVGRVH
jgi:hypothetical protein